MQVYYAIADFNKYLASEDEDRYRTLWKTLYYCSLRIEKARGLQRKDTNWDNKNLWNNKQVQSLDNYSSSYNICNLKTASNNRILTIYDVLYEDLKKYYDDFFIFGNDKDLTPFSYKQTQQRKEEIAQKASRKEI